MNNYYAGFPTSADRDPKDEFLHSVRTADLERFRRGVLPRILADCGKYFAPTLPTDLSKPKCCFCFPPTNHAIAA